MNIEAVTIAQKIAASLVKIPDTPDLLTVLQKKIPEGAPNNYRITDLTDDDFRLLRKIWAALPIPDELNMTREQYALCKKAFEESPDKPEWGLYVGFRDYRAEAKAEMIKIQNSHMALIESEAKQGRIKLLTAHLIPTYKVEPGTLISIEDARAYLEPLGLDTSWLAEIESDTFQPETKAPKGEINQDEQAEQQHETVSMTLTRPAIKKIFSKLSAEQWRGCFDREESNGLGAARIGEPGKPKYVLDTLTGWLVNKGRYTPAEIKAAIEGNIPRKEGTKMADLPPSITHKGTW